jgi:hypothetical protein
LVWHQLEVHSRLAAPTDCGTEYDDLLSRNKVGGSSMGALAAALEAKYGGADAREDSTDGFEEPSEEEFLAAAARLKEKRQGGAVGNKENGREKKKRKAAKQ